MRTDSHALGDLAITVRDSFRHFYMIVFIRNVPL